MSEQTVRTRKWLKDAGVVLEDGDELFYPGTVGVRLGAEDAVKPQAQLVCLMTLNLIVRLYPVVQKLRISVPAGITCSVLGREFEGQKLDEVIHTLLSSIDSETAWEMYSDMPSDECVIQIGRSPHECNHGHTTFVGSDGWNVALSKQSEREVGDKQNPVGAFTTAAFAVAEVWKKLLSNREEIRDTIRFPLYLLDEDLQFSTLTYRTGGNQPNPEVPPSLEMPGVTFVGLGAGGGAAAYTLSALPALSGDVTLIDPDTLEASNLNRYVFATVAHVGKAKVDIVAEHFKKHSELSVTRYEDPFEAVFDKLSYEYVLAAVHSREARRSIQYETPRILWDCGATDTGEFFIWRHYCPVISRRVATG